MKPLRLEFQGIKSYSGNAVVDFKKLTAGGIFGIFGNTGSGKSTILDCIMLALYGRLPKGVGASDFINFTSNFGFVDFTFSMHEEGEEKTYRVRREFKLKKERAVTPQKAVLSEIREGDVAPISEGADGVNAKLLEIIGLKIDDFEKCIILPQGEFSSFVSLTKSNRLQMMSRLFNLDKYGDKLISSVKQKISELREQVGIDNGVLQSLANATKEELDLVQNEITLARENKITIDVKFSKIKDKFSEIEKNYDRHKKLVNLRKQLALLLDDEKDIAVMRENIKCYFEAKTVQKVAREKKEIERKISQSKSNILQVEKSSLSLSESLLRIEDERKTVEKGDELILSNSEKIAVLKTLLVDEKELKQKTSELENLRDEYQEIKKNFQREETDCSRLKSELCELEKRQIVNAFKQKISAVLSKLEGSVDSGLILSEIEFLNSLEQDLNDVALKKVKARISELEKLSKNESVDIRVLLDELKSLYDNVDKESNEINELNKKLLLVTEKIEKLKSNLSINVENGKRIRLECDKITEKINKITSGKNCSDLTSCLETKNRELANAKAAFLKKEKQLSDEKNALDMKMLTANEELKRLEGELSGKGKELSGLFNEKINDEQKADEVVEFVGDYNTSQVRVQNFDNQKYSLNNSIKELENEIGDKDINEEIYNQAKIKLDNVSQELDNNKIKLINLEKTYEILSQNFEKRCIIENRLKRLNAELSLHLKLFDVVKSNALVEFIAEEYLKEIAGLAGKTLLELTDGRFGLCYDGEFMVEDNVLGGERRRVNTVSGGELFLVSLSLALSLSRSIYAKSSKPIEFFFLDEGFGSLDGELVETVMDSLSKLKDSHLTIGVISHVDSLKERISAKIMVSGATEQGGSKLSLSV